MSNLRKQAMDAMLEAASHDIAESFSEQDITDRQSDDADEAVFDVAILYAYRVFTRICEHQGLSIDAGLFADLATELADEIVAEEDEG
ncbi:MAG: hypothetical protein WCF85_13790 [Rhodospirillaceae bacterium]